MLSESELQEALNGAAVELNGEIGCILPSKTNTDYFIVELETECLRVHKDQILQVDLKIAGVKFENWHLINGVCCRIKKVTETKWQLMNGDVSTATFHRRDFAEGFFPECPVGTVIYRPKNTRGDQ